MKKPEKTIFVENISEYEMSEGLVASGSIGWVSVKITHGAVARGNVCLASVKNSLR